MKLKCLVCEQEKEDFEFDFDNCDKALPICEECQEIEKEEHGWNI